MDITGKRTKPTHMVFVVMHSVHNRRLAWLPLVTKPISSFAAKSASSLLVSVERANNRPNGAKFPYFYLAPSLERHSKGQFLEIRHISKEICRIFAFVDTNAVLVKKIGKS